MITEPTLNTIAAAQVHYVDPRVRQLAYARYHLATGRSFMAWLALGKNHPDALISEARDWLRAAVAAGLLPPPDDCGSARHDASVEAAEPEHDDGACTRCGTTEGDVWPIDRPGYFCRDCVIQLTGRDPEG